MNEDVNRATSYITQDKIGNFNACQPENEDPIKLMNPQGLSKRKAANKESLLQILKEKDASFKHRVLAVQYLSNFKDPEVEKELITLLRDSDNHPEQFAILDSLAEVGTQKSLKALEKVSRKRNKSFNKQLNFTKLVISSRLRDDIAISLMDKLMKDAAKIDTDDTIPLNFKPLVAKDTKEIVGNMYGSRFGIQLSNTLGFEIQSGIQKLYLLMNKESDDPTKWAKALANPMILGVLAKQSDLGDRVYQKYVVLSQPKSKHTLFTAFKSNGELILAGKLTTDKNMFNLSNVAKPTEKQKIVMKEGDTLILDLQFQRKQPKKKTVEDTPY